MFVKLTELTACNNFLIVPCRPIGDFKSSSDYQYQLLRCNVDLLKIIQLGLTFLDSRGHMPEGVTTWQFNFRSGSQNKTKTSVEHGKCANSIHVNPPTLNSIVISCGFIASLATRFKFKTFDLFHSFFIESFFFIQYLIIWLFYQIFRVD